MNSMNNVMQPNDPSNIITLRSVYGKVKTYYFNPLRGKNGMYPPFVKRVRVSADGRDTEMILSEAELNSPDRDYFIPEDLEIVVTDGTTFNLMISIKQIFGNVLKILIWLLLREVRKMNMEIC